VADSYEKGN